MTEIDVTIEGLDELLDGIQRKYPQAYKDEIGGAMEKSVIQVQGWARENAPVEFGLMRASIAHEVSMPFGDVVGVVFSDIKYAPFVEFGGGKPRGVGRIPWLRPAVEEHTEKIIGNFKSAVKRIVTAMAR